jgi:tRNA nucleotidyltransferase/poly(A) polymerase
MSTPSHISPDRAAAERIVRRLRAHGFTAYFAGGCVRDELLGLTPDDYDVATDATPQTVRDIFKSSLEVGAHFGVVIVKIEGAVIEVATFRTDGPYSDRRRPDSVRFSTASEDAARRDFTFNALFLDPAPDLPSPTLAPGNAPHPEGVLYDPPQVHTVPGGLVIDYVGGLPDLSVRMLRAVGNPDHRLAEDHLRALRAARLAAKLGCTIHPDTLQAVQRHARELSGVSRERVGEEIRRMLDHPARANAAVLLDELHLTRVILGLQTDPAADAPYAHLGGLPPGCEWPTPLAAWLLDLGPAPDGKLAAAALRKPLCLSNDECAALAGTLDALARLEGAWDELSVAQRKRLAGSDHFGPALRLLRIRSSQWAVQVEKQVRELSASHGGLTPAPMVTGDDLIAAGMRPGPGFKKVLDDVYDAQLEGRVRNQADAMELARRLGV